jgi:outer membrane protein TolC
MRVAESMLDFAEQRYRRGLGDRLAVLAAQGGVLVQRQQAAELNARLIDTQLALIRALGGGFAADEPAR